MELITASQLEAMARADAALRDELDGMLRWRSTLREMHEGLARAFNLRVSYSAVRTYRQRRDRRREAQEEMQCNCRALAEVARNSPHVRPAVKLLTRMVEIECGACAR